MHNNNNGYPSNLAAWTTVAILMVAYVLLSLIHISEPTRPY